MACSFAFEFSEVAAVAVAALSLFIKSTGPTIVLSPHHAQIHTFPPFMVLSSACIQQPAHMKKSICIAEQRQAHQN